MSIYLHAPQPALRPFIEWLWYYADFYPDRRLFHRQAIAQIYDPGKN